MSGGSRDLFEILRQIPAIPGYLLTAGQLVRWAWGRYTGWRRAHKPPARELVDHRIRMRQQIEENLRTYRQRPDTRPTEERSYEEIIVHDTKRLDEFPELRDDDVGISPWLKLEVNGFYHRGVEVFLSEGKKAVPVADEDGFLGGWRFLRHDEESQDAVYALPIGRIPFDFIERIDWARDEYYGAPHFYCRYASRLREPYEEIVYKAILYPGESRYYTELHGLRRESDDWGTVRRRLFLMRQDTLRLWRRFRRGRKAVTAAIDAGKSRE